ncbi:MAG TPA: sigma-70 family RNA polymerase sigma factor [Vicinamibacterales bacterium]
MADDAALAQTAADEQALVQRLRARDPKAFETLVRTQTPRMLAVARRMLPTDEDARDAVQDAFLNAYRSIDGFEGQSRLSTWLHRIVVNAALMKLRTRRRRPEEPLEVREPEFLPDGHHATRYGSWADDVEELAGREHTRQLVRDAILSLPENYRDVVILRDIQELSTEEAARMLGITPNAVKIRLHRARQTLRDVLDAHFRRGDQ